MEVEGVLGLDLERELGGEERTKGREREGTETAGWEVVGTGTEMEGEVLGLDLERDVGGEEGTKGRETEEVETAGREGVIGLGLEKEGAKRGLLKSSSSMES